MKRARRTIATFGFLAAALLLFLSTRIENAVLGTLVLACASFANDLAMPVAWGTCMDIGGRFAGTLSGSMNMMGQLGGTLCPIAVAQILKYTGNNWVITFWTAAAVYLVGAACWIFIDPVTPLDEPLTELACSRHS